MQHGRARFVWTISSELSQMRLRDLGNRDSTVENHIDAVPAQEK
jgi:hypothetical protein